MHKSSKIDITDCRKLFRIILKFIHAHQHFRIKDSDDIYALQDLTEMKVCKNVDQFFFFILE